MNSKHIKLNIKEHEINDFPLESLKFSEFWKDLLYNDNNNSKKYKKTKWKN
jgi:hypothetical protein